MKHAQPNAGFTLVELMMVLLVMAVVASVVIPSATPGRAEQLAGTAQAVAADLARVRGLAVATNSNYRVTFQALQNRYYLEHVGSNAALNTLPPALFHNSADTATRQYSAVDQLSINSHVLLAGVGATNGALRGTVEYGPYGETTVSDATVIWLTNGVGDRRLYVPVTINPVSGLALAGDVTTIAPPSSLVTIKLE